MTDFQMDDYLKNRLAEYQSPVPEDMWARITLKKNKDRKGILYFFRLFGLPALGILTAIYFFKPIDRISNLSKSSIPTQSKSLTIPKNENLIKNDQHAVNSTLKKSVIIEKPGYKLSQRRDNEYDIQKEKEINKNEIQETISDTLSDKSSDETGRASDSVTKIEILSARKNSAIPEKNPQLNEKNKQTDTSHLRKWSLDLYASPDFPFLPEPYEKMQLSYTVGIRVVRSFGKHFSGKIGIQYAQINYNVIDSNRFESTNHLKSWDLPVLIGYTFGKNTNLTVNTGIVLNLNTRFQGSSPGDFKSNTGVSLYLGLNYIHAINRHLSVFGEPYYRYRLTSMTLPSVSTNKFIDVAGLSIGLRYYFGKYHE